MVSAVSLGSTHLYRNPVVDRVQRFVSANWQVLFLGLVGVVLVGTLAYKCCHVVPSRVVNKPTGSRGTDRTPPEVNAKPKEKVVNVVPSEVVAKPTDREVIHEVPSEVVAKPTDREVIEAVMCLDSKRSRKCISEGGNVN
ncbi:MAG TPA: hypothetical protein PLO43_04980, partial [Chlamydiales bacterium]|nr:hypothetical protein [Chlamydiales bacterium]